jgi:hypothetical protein
MGDLQGLRVGVNETDLAWAPCGDEICQQSAGE